ncbi:glycosyl transferase family 28 [Rivularia sp. IAM M-261]|nr:glycosyl transferase family 28 [Calothrix sp. PCC 7716]GJD23667.1 glycosyl transferase family 28 [Rivularia sp. IAM M-261]
MRIAIIALGSRGDVQPYVALGKGLKQAGHLVRLVTQENFGDLVCSNGLEFWAVSGNVQEIVETKEMRELLEKGNFLAIQSRTAKLVQSVAIDWANQGKVACQGMDLLIVGVGGLNIAVALAQKLGIPLLQAYVFPFTPTKEFPGVLFPDFVDKTGGFFNRLSHQLVRQALWQGFRNADKLVRQKVLGLPAASFWGPYNTDCLKKYPTLYGFSPSVISKPSDWNNTCITGYWFLDVNVQEVPDWSPPSALMEFLQSGSPPIYIGFGSMGNRNPEATVNLVLEALAKTQQRAILLSGWSGLKSDNLPNTVYLIDSVPHSWLFPRVAAVVHHGGAGTTAAGMRAGVPSIIIPFFGDQFFWGQRVAKLGVGTEPIPRKQLTAERLAQAIQETLADSTMRKRAANLGAKIQAENGIAGAVAVVEEIEKHGVALLY